MIIKNDIEISLLNQTAGTIFSGFKNIEEVIRFANDKRRAGYDAKAKAGYIEDGSPDWKNDYHIISSEEELTNEIKIFLGEINWQEELVAERDNQYKIIKRDKIDFNNFSVYIKNQ